MTHDSDLSIRYFRVVKSPYPLQKFPEQPYFDFMFSKLDKHGHRVILVDGLSGEEFTYQGAILV